MDSHRFLSLATTARIGSRRNLRVGIILARASLVQATGAAALLFFAINSDNAMAQCSGQFGATQMCGSVAGGLPGPVTYAASATTDATKAANEAVPWVELEDYAGGSCTASSGADCTAALNAAAAAMSNTSTRVIIKLRPGAYKFTSKPNNFTAGVIIWCAGMSQTTLDRFYSAGSADEGFLTWSGAGSNGGGIVGCSVTADNHSTSGSMLKFTTGTNEVAGFHFVKDVFVSRADSDSDYTRALLVDGSANKVSGSQGLRDFYIERSFLFHGFAGTESARFINSTNLLGSSNWANGSVVITGDGTALGNTTNANWNATVIAQVFVSNSTLVSLSGEFDSLIFSTGTTNSCSAAYVPPGSYSDTGTGNLQGGCAKFTGATGGVTGYPGIVPGPIAGQQAYVLLGNGTWDNVSNAIDNGIGSTRGSILERGSGGWAIVAPGTSGLPLVSAGAGADPAYSQVAIGALQMQTRPGGRLTLTTGVPVLTADAVAQATLYYTPYQSDLVSIYNGTTWQLKAFAELSVSLASSANWASGSLYDWFVANDSGTIRLCSGPAWSSATSRGTGAGTTQISMLNGLWINTVSITCRYGAASTTTVAASQGTYVGTTYMTANGQTGMAFKPAGASGGTNNILGVYNGYNRVMVMAASRDTATGIAGANNSAVRSFNNSASDRISFVDGLQQSAVSATHATTAAQVLAGAYVGIGVALDSTTVASGTAGQHTAAFTAGVYAMDIFTPQIGFHFVQALETSQTGGTATFNPTSVVAPYQELAVHLEM